jgi:hypothetical protein
VDWINTSNTIAFAAALAAAVAVFVAYRQVLELRRTLGAQTYSQVEEKFYYSNLMRNLRRRASAELLSGNTFSAFDELADFFEYVGVLVRRGIIDEEMAANSYRSRAAAYWYKACERKLIENIRKDQPFRWSDFEYLVKIYSAKPILAQDQIDRILSREQNLPILDEKI